MFQAPNDLLRAHEDYSKNYYLGTVVANEDPLNCGRIKANVPGLYETALGDVPWIGPKKDSPFGFGPGYGVYGYPAIGSKVLIELQNGDEHRPLYTTALTAPNANPNFNGPNVWGYEDPDGNMMIYNLQTKTYSLIFASGARVDIDGSGNRTTKVANDTLNCSELQINVSGNANVNVTGTATYSAAAHAFHGPVTMDSTLKVAGDITDNTSGTPGTMREMRTVYNEHNHQYDDGTTGTPNQQTPN